MSKKNNRLVAYIITPLIFTLAGSVLLFFGLLRPTEGIVRAFDSHVGENPPVFGEPDIQRVVNQDSIETPSHGAFYANVYSERFNYSAKVYYGISTRLMKKGICQINDTALIGCNGTTVLYADNEGAFWVLEDMAEGDVLRIDTGYGSFEYEVTLAKVGYENEIAVSKDSEPALIMYTEYPFKSNHKSDTYAKEYEEKQAGAEGTHKLIFAKKTSGPLVEKVAEVQ